MPVCLCGQRRVEAQHPEDPRMPGPAFARKLTGLRSWPDQSSCAPNTGDVFLTPLMWRALVEKVVPFGYS